MRSICHAERMNEQQLAGSCFCPDSTEQGELFAPLRAALGKRGVSKDPQQWLLHPSRSEQERRHVNLAARVSDRKRLTAKVGQSTAHLMRAGYLADNDSATGPENDFATRTVILVRQVA